MPAQTINKSVYEAADIDGAGEGRKFFSITLPLLRPVLAMVLVVTVIGSFQIFDTVSVTTQGGPVNATRVINYYIWDLVFGQLDFGYACRSHGFVCHFDARLAHSNEACADESDEL